MYMCRFGFRLISAPTSKISYGTCYRRISASGTATSRMASTTLRNIVGSVTSTGSLSFNNRSYTDVCLHGLLCCHFHTTLLSSDTNEKANQQKYFLYKQTKNNTQKKQRQQGGVPLQKIALWAAAQQAYYLSFKCPSQLEPSYLTPTTTKRTNFSGRFDRLNKKLC